jgi:hypothetical protein
MVRASFPPLGDGAHRVTSAVAAIFLHNLEAVALVDLASDGFEPMSDFSRLNLIASECPASADQEVIEFSAESHLI